MKKLPTLFILGGLSQRLQRENQQREQESKVPTNEILRTWMEEQQENQKRERQMYTGLGCVFVLIVVAILCVFGYVSSGR